MTDTVIECGGRPAGGYRLADGSRCRGVTTVSDRFKESGGLVHWAWEQGRAGHDYRTTSRKAANVGTLTHACIEADILGRSPPVFTAGHFDVTSAEWIGMQERAAVAVDAFRRWRRAAELEIVAVELPIVSESLRLGGTIDAIARVEGRMSIFDWKSSGGVYANYLVQLGGYRLLWNTERVTDDRSQRIDDAHLVRIDSTFGSFSHRHWPAAVLDVAEHAFRLEHELYDLDRTLKKAAK